jgi:YD repeat-containing protein
VSLSPTPWIQTVAYNAIGNITFRSDVGTYSYPVAGQPKPHGVTSISGGVINTTFSYDAKGNMTSGNGPDGHLHLLQCPGDDHARHHLPNRRRAARRRAKTEGRRGIDLRPRRVHPAACGEETPVTGSESRNARRGIARQGHLNGEGLTRR